MRGNYDQMISDQVNTYEKNQSQEQLSYSDDNQD